MMQEGKNNSTINPYTATRYESKAHRVFTNVITAMLLPYGLSLSQWNILGALVEIGQLQPSEVAAELGLKRPVVTKLLHELQAKGIIQRDSHHSDNRAYIASLTPHGHQLVKKIEQHLQREIKAFTDTISSGEWAVYSSVVQKIASSGIK